MVRVASNSKKRVRCQTKNASRSKHKYGLEKLFAWVLNSIQCRNKKKRKLESKCIKQQAQSETNKGRSKPKNSKL